MDYLQEIKEEEKELEAKFEKLILFIGSEEFFKLDFYQQKKLIEQQTFMRGYLEVLISRISYEEQKMRDELR